MPSGGFFSIKQKLLLVGVLLVLVALAVGTQDHPGVLTQSQQQIDSAARSRAVAGHKSPWAGDAGKSPSPNNGSSEPEHKGPVLKPLT